MPTDKKKRDKKSNLSQSTIHQYVSSTPQQEMRNKHGISPDTSGRSNKRDSLSSTDSPSIVSHKEKRKNNEDHKSKVSKKQKISSDSEINLRENQNLRTEISAVSPVKSKNKKTLKSGQPSVDNVSKSSVKEKLVNNSSSKRKNESIANVLSPDKNVMKSAKKRNKKFTNSNDGNHRLNVQPMEVSSSPSKKVQHNRRSSLSNDTALKEVEDRHAQKVSNSRQQKAVSPTESSHSEDSSSDEISHDEEQVARKKVVATDFVEQEDSLDEEAEDQFNEDEEKTDGSGWSHDQTAELVMLMKEQMEIDANDKWVFRKRVKRLIWGSLPSSLHPPRTQEECEIRLQQIISSVVSTRNLYEMLSAYKYKKAGMKAQVLAPLQRFCRENSDEIRQKRGNFFQTAKALYEALPEEERKLRYIDPYEMEKLNTKRSVVTPSHSGLFFYCEHHAGTDKKLLKQQYDQLKPGKKIKYIRKAVDDHRRAVNEHKEKQSSSKNVTLKPPLNHITKQDWKLLLSAKGMPTLAYTNPLQIFNERKEQEVNSEGEGGMSSEGNSKNNNLKNYLSFQRSSLFEECKATYLRLIDEYSREYHTWLPTLNDPLLQQQAALCYKEVMVTAEKVPNAKKKTSSSAASSRPANKPLKTPKSTRISKTKQIADKVQQLEDSCVEVTMTGSFFKHEPKRPPMTSKEFFISYVKSKLNHGAVNMTTVNDSYQKLPAKEKDQCGKKAEMAVLKYKADLKQFVKGLDDYERKVYIGQNRIRFIRIFEGTDIFEKEFPCSKYPPFKRMVRPKGSGSGSSDVEDIALDIDQILTDVAASPEKKIKTHVEESDESKSEEEDDDEDSEDGNENNDPEVKVNERKTTAVSEEVFKKMMKSTSTPEVREKKRKDSESEESEEEKSETVLVQMGKKSHAKELAKQSDDSASDEETSEEEEKAVVQPTQSTSPSKRFSLSTVTRSRGLAKQNSDSGASEESSSSSEEEDDNKNKIEVRPAKLPQQQKVEEDSDESEEDVESAWM